MEMFLRLPEVKRRVALSRSTIYERMRDGRFPHPVDLSGNGRAKAWVESEINEWIEKRIAESRGTRGTRGTSK